MKWPNTPLIDWTSYSPQTPALAPEMSQPVDAARKPTRVPP